MKLFFKDSNTQQLFFNEKDQLVYRIINNTKLLNSNNNELGFIKFSHKLNIMNLMKEKIILQLLNGKEVTIIKKNHITKNTEYEFSADYKIEYEYIGNKPKKKLINPYEYNIILYYLDRKIAVIKPISNILKKENSGLHIDAALPTKYQYLIEIFDEEQIILIMMLSSIICHVNIDVSG